MDRYLSGGEYTMLTVLYWTPAPFQNGWDTKANRMALDRLIERGLAKQTDFNDDGAFSLTEKGACLMGAILAIPEPEHIWRIPSTGGE